MEEKRSTMATSQISRNGKAEVSSSGTTGKVRIKRAKPVKSCGGIVRKGCEEEEEEAESK